MSESTFHKLMKREFMKYLVEDNDANQYIFPASERTLSGNVRPDITAEVYKKGSSKPDAMLSIEVKTNKQFFKDKHGLNWFSTINGIKCVNVLVIPDCILHEAMFFIGKQMMDAEREWKVFVFNEYGRIETSKEAAKRLDISF